MLGVGGVGLFCGRVHLQKRENKGNQGKTRERKEKQGKQRETKGKQGKTKGGDQGKTKETKKTPSINKRNTFQSMGVSSINRIPF